MIEEPILASTPVTQGRRISRRFVIGGLIVAAAVVYLMVTAARGATAYYLTVSELGNQDSMGRQVRVIGNVVGDSVSWSPQDLVLEFAISDPSGTVQVVYHGARPDMLLDSAEVVVEGRYEEGALQAKTLLLKCPSKYEVAQDG